MLYLVFFSRCFDLLHVKQNVTSSKTNLRHGLKKFGYVLNPPCRNEKLVILAKNYRNARR